MRSSFVDILPDRRHITLLTLDDLRLPGVMCDIDGDDWTRSDARGNSLASMRRGGSLSDEHDRGAVDETRGT
jgi:hypothetical protein